ncbi:P-loop containing nucleoside triphosphate hydrolase protein [Linnemannia elongata]|nr:P-loop containing nucleoside triphosphate hydrolase protein [Linnemannia elongata]
MLKSVADRLGIPSPAPSSSSNPSSRTTSPTPSTASLASSTTSTSTAHRTSMMYASPRPPARPLPQAGQLPKPTGSSSGLLTPQNHHAGSRTPTTTTTPSPGTTTNLRKISVSTPTTTTKPVLPPPLATQQAVHASPASSSSHLDSHSSTATTTATTPTAAVASATAAANPPGGSKTENVTVTVRIRPFSSSELKVAGGPTEVWTVGDTGSSIAYTDDYAVQARRVAVDYNYDHALTGSDNELIYNTSVKNLVQSAMEGYNGTVFAYGQTSSGKTYTMSGNETQPGITPRAVEDVFKYIRENSDREFLLRVSYLEIYNESIRDLLSPEAIDLRIHEDKRRGVYVSPLKEEIVTAPSQVMRIIERGDYQRHVSSTDFNAHSSRSHSIFQIVIESRDRSPATAGSPTARKPGSKSASAVRVSQLNLIDLAGSEKASSNEERRKEGAFINKSLLTLGTVISKLTEEKGAHIPYRDSKLTRILQSSLNGSARVSVICTISPSYLNVEESNNTLKFAARVKKIVTKAQTNQVMDDKALLEKYRREISELKAQLMLTAGDGSAGSGSAGNGAAAPQQAELSSLLQKERRKHEEEMVEMNMVRNALKERIDHLTKLILTSSSVHTKGTGAPDPPMARYTVETSADGTVMEFPKEIESRLARKDTIVKELQMELEAQQEKMALMKTALEKAVKGDSVDLEKTLAKVEHMDDHNPPREKFLSEKRASIMNIKNLEEFDGVDGGDLAALKALQQQQQHPEKQDRALQRLDSRGSGKSALAIDDEDEDEELKDTPWNRAELQSLRQAKRELEIVVMDQERKLEDMVAFEDSDEFRELIIEMEEQREKIVAMEEEREGFRIMITELRNTIRKMEIAGSSSTNGSSAAAGAGSGASASASSAASTMAAAAAARIREVEQVAQKERRLRMEEQTRNMGRIASLEAELTMLKAELSVRNLADF